jgi:hypothetical protein
VGALALLGAAAVPAVGTTGPTADLATGNLFMGTTKVEVGARPNGSFGSAIAAPGGYSPLTDGGVPILGFRVNPTECTWADPGCVKLGDFFTPGSPYEAWGIQVGNGAPGFNSNAVTDVPGAFTSVDGVQRDHGQADLLHPLLRLDDRHKGPTAPCRTPRAGAELHATTERRRGPDRPPSHVLPFPRPPRRSGAAGSCYIIPPPMPMPPMFGLMPMPLMAGPASSGLSATTHSVVMMFLAIEAAF